MTSTIDIQAIVASQAAILKAQAVEPVTEQVVSRETDVDERPCPCFNPASEPDETVAPGVSGDSTSENTTVARPPEPIPSVSRETNAPVSRETTCPVCTKPMHSHRAILIDGAFQYVPCKAKSAPKPRAAKPIAPTQLVANKPATGLARVINGKLVYDQPVVVSRETSKTAASSVAGNGAVSVVSPAVSAPKTATPAMVVSPSVAAGMVRFHVREYTVEVSSSDHAALKAILAGLH